MSKKEKRSKALKKKVKEIGNPAVIFSFDGTIMDTEPAIFASYRHIFAMFSKNRRFTTEEENRVIGQSSIRMLKEFFPKEDPDEMPVFDKHGVGYSADGKKLLCCRFTFRDTRYEVPDGVGEIDDFAFVACRHYLELSIPRSVHTIGDSLFGNGGIILVREE